MSNPLYLDKIDIYKSVNVEDELGFDTVKFEKILEDVSCNVQSYSTEKMEKEYGYRVDTTKRIFTDVNENITEDCLIYFENKYYKIQKIIEHKKLLLAHYDIAIIENDKVVDLNE